MADALADGHDMVHGWLGLVCTDQSTSTAAGPEVTTVFAGGPAAAAGVQTGDLVQAVDGHPVATIAELQARLYTLPPGTNGQLDAGAGGDGRRVVGDTVGRAGLSGGGRFAPDRRRTMRSMDFTGRRRATSSSSCSATSCRSWAACPVRERGPASTWPGPWPRAWPTGGQPEANVDPAARIELEELVRVAELHVAELTGMPVTPSGAPVETLAVAPGAWAMQTVDDWRFLLDAMTGPLRPRRPAPSPAAANPSGGGDGRAGAENRGPAVSAWGLGDADSVDGGARGGQPDADLIARVRQRPWAP